MKNWNHQRNCSSQSEKRGQPMREQKYSQWRKQLMDIQGERKSGLGQKWKVSTVDIRINKSGLKFIHSEVPSSDQTFFSHWKIDDSLNECPKKLDKWKDFLSIFYLLFERWRFRGNCYKSVWVKKYCIAVTYL